MSSVPNISEGELSIGVRREPLMLALGIVVIYAVMAMIALATHDWDPKAFVLERPDDVPFAQAFAIGYDGQFSYAIALDPIGAGESDALDRPAYRYLRIVYPVAARIFALGSDNSVARHFATLLFSVETELDPISRTALSSSFRIASNGDDLGNWASKSDFCGGGVEFRA